MDWVVGVVTGADTIDDQAVNVGIVVHDEISEHFHKGVNLQPHIRRGPVSVKTNKAWWGV